MKKAFCLTKDQITKAKDLPREKVFVPEWADGNPEAYVVLVGMTGKDKGKFEEALVKPETKDQPKQEMDMIKYGPLLAIFSMCDDDGNRLFTPEDLPVLEGKSAKALDRVVRKAMELNGMAPEAVSRAAKNSSPNQSDSSPSN